MSDHRTVGDVFLPNEIEKINVLTEELAKIANGNPVFQQAVMGVMIGMLDAQAKHDKVSIHEVIAGFNARVIDAVGEPSMMGGRS